MSFSIGEACIGCTACVRVCPVQAISGEKKEQHRIDPARCIECGACGRVCPAGAVTDDQGQAVPRLMPRKKWPKPVFRLAQCISCGLCQDQCPVDCITLSEGKPGGLEAYPELTAPNRCVSCGYCAFYCPMDCITIETPPEEPPKEAPQGLEESP